MANSRGCAATLALLLAAAGAYAQVEFFYDAGSAALGYRSPDKMLVEMEVTPLTLVGTAVPVFLEFSPLHVAGIPDRRTDQLRLEVEGLTFVNLTAGYALVFGGNFMLSPAFQLHCLDPADVARVRFGPRLQLSLVYHMDGLSHIPHLQQRLASLSAGVDFSNRDGFAARAHVTAGVNILALASFFQEAGG